MPKKRSKHTKPEKKIIHNPPSKPRNLRIKPTIKRFFYVLKQDLDLSIYQTIFAHNFIDDHGNHISNFPNIGENGYINLFINGLMQEGDVYSLNVHSLCIKNIGGRIFSGTPIIIECVEFRIFEFN
ncbi:DUF4183 domain-containing protein [Bacillus salipaludis]|uniref:DUF4183 domain-containing protein n=1 Tax=Bacillus salipaludis TaxID=2547811 RepID=UPI003D1DF31B